MKLNGLSSRTNFILIIFGILAIAGFFTLTSEKSTDPITSPSLTSSPVPNTTDLIKNVSSSPEISTSPISRACEITGCSSQLCSDEEVITTCEFKEEYACYKTAKCARQEDGKCGWTPTEELVACLSEIFKVETEH